MGYIMKKILAAVSLSVISIGLAAPADAADLAIFGNNNIATYYTSLGNNVTIVTDAQLATAGYLNGFDAFVYTRDGYSFGSSLSVAAAANVKTYVTGNVVLFSADFQDDIGDADTNALFKNALNYVLATPHGYIGEFNGALAAFASNAQGFTPIGLVNGAAGVLGNGLGGSAGDVSITPIGASSSIVTGVSATYNPAGVEYGFDEAGYNPNKVIAAFTNGNPAIIASGVDVISAAVPEPATWAMMIGGFALAGSAMRRRAKATVRYSVA